MLQIFDLDNVLSLGWLNPARKAEYEERLRSWLLNRREKGDILTVASSNHQAREVLAQMGLSDLFHHIEADSKVESKVPMLNKIMSMFPHIDITSVRFYDDDVDHVEAARNLGIQSYCIAPRTGIPMLVIQSK
jgi:FMN phosphatase YigB (HAD superfamily)